MVLLQYFFFNVSHNLSVILFLMSRLLELILSIFVLFCTDFIFSSSLSFFLLSMSLYFSSDSSPKVYIPRSPVSRLKFIFTKSWLYVNLLHSPLSSKAILDLLNFVSSGFSINLEIVVFPVPLFPYIKLFFLELTFHL